MAKTTKKKRVEELEEEEPLEDDEDFEDEEEYEEDEFDEDDELDDLEEDEEAQDPYWWAPHLVLSLLLLIALLGFFGLFNEYLGHLAPSPDDHAAQDESAAVMAASTAPSAAPAPPHRPTARARPEPSGEVYGVRHILVQYEGARKSQVDRSKEDAKKLADSIIAAAKKTRAAENRAEAWKTLAVEKGDDPNAEKTGGDLGLFRPGAYEAAFTEAVKSLDVGAVGGPVETSFGYHIIWRTR